VFPGFHLDLARCARRGLGDLLGQKIKDMLVLKFFAAEAAMALLLNVIIAPVDIVGWCVELYFGHVEPHSCLFRCFGEDLERRDRF
jgi:hypothetical protein